MTYLNALSAQWPPSSATRVTLESLDSVATALAAPLAHVAMLWLSAVVLLEIAGTLPGRVGRYASSAAAAIAPRAVHVAVRGLCAALVALVGVGATSWAAPAPTSGRDAAGGRAAGADPVASAALQIGRPGVAAAPVAPGCAVEVQPGDTLWSIVAGRLEDPTAALVAGRWPAWFERNRRVIGPDPDLLTIGTTLRCPR
jgi:hypothetical protein